MTVQPWSRQQCQTAGIPEMVGVLAHLPGRRECLGGQVVANMLRKPVEVEGLKQYTRGLVGGEEGQRVVHHNVWLLVADGREIE